jgi:catechol-2,3-dioxygenase
MTSFDHLSLCATNLDNSISFFTDVVGLTLVSRREDDSQAVFQVGESLLVLFHGDAYQSIDTDIRSGMHHVAFCLDSDAYDGVLLRLQERALPYRGPTMNKGAHGEGLATYFRDPDGNELEIKKYG